jgi:spore germination protein GerM
MRGARIVAIVVVAGLSACGVPTQHSAGKVESKDVPFGLLDKKSGFATSDKSGALLVVFLAKGSRLEPAVRRLEPPVTLERVVGVLTAGPTKAEIATGVRSALPEETTFNAISLAKGTANIDLSSPFTGLSSTDQILALAQLVYTATAQPGIGLVRFTLQGATIAVPRGDGSLTSAPVSRDDYGAVAPRG